MDKDIALGMEVGRLFAALQSFNLGEQDAEQAGLIE